MQENVNAVNVLNSIVQNFGDERVSTCDGGIIKLQVKSLGNGDVLSISNMLQWSDVRIKRSGVGILVLFIPKPNFGEYSQEVLNAIDSIKGDTEIDVNDIKASSRPVKQLTVRDFFENLPQDERMAAFDNTAKSKWNNPVKDLEEAILTSFYISDSPQGANYWQNIILENSKISV